RNLVIAVVAVGLARALMMMGRRLIAGRQALAVEMDLRTQLYARLVRLSFGFYDRHQTGQLMSRATVDLQGVRFFLGYGLIFFFQSVAANRQRALYVPLMSFLPLLAQAAVLLVGGRMVAHGTLSLANFIAFSLLLGMLVMPLRMLGMWIGQAQRATASGERIFEIIDEPEEVAALPHAEAVVPGPGRVEFENVWFGYGGNQPVLKGIDLDVEAGRTIALI